MNSISTLMKYLVYGSVPVHRNTRKGLPGALYEPIYIIPNSRGLAASFVRFLQTGEISGMSGVSLVSAIVSNAGLNLEGSLSGSKITSTVAVDPAVASCFVDNWADVPFIPNVQVAFPSSILPRVRQVTSEGVIATWDKLPGIRLKSKTLGFIPKITEIVVEAAAITSEGFFPQYRGLPAILIAPKVHWGDYVPPSPEAVEDSFVGVRDQSDAKPPLRKAIASAVATIINQHVASNQLLTEERVCSLVKSSPTVTGFIGVIAGAILAQIISEIVAIIFRRMIRGKA